MKVLIVDNNIDRDSWGAENLVRYARKVAGATVFVRRAPENDLPVDPLGFDRIVLSGSKTSAMEDGPWIARLHDFIRRSVNENKPFLGVCFGHQALARALGGSQTVRKAAEPEYGWTAIRLNEKSELTQNIPRDFYSFSAHYEEVSSLPKGMRRLASSAACQIQACQLETKPVFGIQFHPEKDAEEAKKILLERKKKKEPKQLLNPEKTDTLYDPKIAETLFDNFFKL